MKIKTHYSDIVGKKCIDSITRCIGACHIKESPSSYPCTLIVKRYTNSRIDNTLTKKKTVVVPPRCRYSYTRTQNLCPLLLDISSSVVIARISKSCSHYISL